MAGISTHVLDTESGRPGVGIPVGLSRRSLDAWTVVAEATTDDDGRVSPLLAPNDTIAGTYRIVFDTAAYRAIAGRTIWYPEVSVVFPIDDPSEHYHVPLLLSAHGYTTYRGS